MNKKQLHKSKSQRIEIVQHAGQTRTVQNKTVKLNNTKKSFKFNKKSTVKDLQSAMKNSKVSERPAALHAFAVAKGVNAAVATQFVQHQTESKLSDLNFNKALSTMRRAEVMLNQAVKADDDIALNPYKDTKRAIRALGKIALADANTNLTGKMAKLIHQGLQPMMVAKMESFRRTSKLPAWIIGSEEKKKIENELLVMDSYVRKTSDIRSLRGLGFLLRPVRTMLFASSVISFESGLKLTTQAVAAKYGLNSSDDVIDGEVARVEPDMMAFPITDVIFFSKAIIHKIAVELGLPDADVEKEFYPEGRGKRYIFKGTTGLNLDWEEDSISADIVGDTPDAMSMYKPIYDKMLGRLTAQMTKFQTEYTQQYEDGKFAPAMLLKLEIAGLLDAYGMAIMSQYADLPAVILEDMRRDLENSRSVSANQIGALLVTMNEAVFQKPVSDFNEATRLYKGYYNKEFYDLIKTIMKPATQEFVSRNVKYFLDKEQLSSPKYMHKLMPIPALPFKDDAVKAKKSDGSTGFVLSDSAFVLDEFYYDEKTMTYKSDFTVTAKSWFFESMKMLDGDKIANLLKDSGASTMYQNLTKHEVSGYPIAVDRDALTILKVNGRYSFKYEPDYADGVATSAGDSAERVLGLLELHNSSMSFISVIAVGAYFKSPDAMWMKENARYIEQMGAGFNRVLELAPKYTVDNKHKSYRQWLEGDAVKNLDGVIYALETSGVNTYFLNEKVQVQSKDGQITGVIFADNKELTSYTQSSVVEALYALNGTTNARKGSNEKTKFKTTSVFAVSGVNVIDDLQVERFYRYDHPKAFLTTKTSSGDIVKGVDIVAYHVTKTKVDTTLHGLQFNSFAKDLLTILATDFDSGNQYGKDSDVKEALFAIFGTRNGDKRYANIEPLIITTRSQLLAETGLDVTGKISLNSRLSHLVSYLNVHKPITLQFGGAANAKTMFLDYTTKPISVQTDSLGAMLVDKLTVVADYDEERKR